MYIAGHYVPRVPANAPVAAFWSVIVYDVSTRALIANKQQIADKSSRMDLDKNEDGSVDIYIGPDKPESGTANWIPTVRLQGGIRLSPIVLTYGTLLQPELGIAGDRESAVTNKQPTAGPEETHPPSKPTQNHNRTQESQFTCPQRSTSTTSTQSGAQSCGA